MAKRYWAYKNVALVPDSSQMYRVSYGLMSDLYEWSEQARNEFEKNESKRK